jgi:hypothetical protein
MRPRSWSSTPRRGAGPHPRVRDDGDDDNLVCKIIMMNITIRIRVAAVSLLRGPTRLGHALRVVGGGSRGEASKLRRRGLCGGLHQRQGGARGRRPGKVPNQRSLSRRAPVGHDQRVSHLCVWLDGTGQALKADLVGSLRERIGLLREESTRELEERGQEGQGERGMAKAD